MPRYTTDSLLVEIIGNTAGKNAFNRVSPPIATLGDLAEAIKKYGVFVYSGEALGFYAPNSPVARNAGKITWKRVLTALHATGFDWTEYANHKIFVADPVSIDEQIVETIEKLTVLLARYVEIKRGEDKD